MKTVALLIYPEFSMQEVANLMFLFRWAYDSKTVVYATHKELVYSEEGLGIMPERTVDEFHKEDHHCLILSGCSDFREVLGDHKLFEFLHSFREESTFVIGAICSSPLLLSMAGVLHDKKFTNSVFYEVNKEFSAIQFENLVNAPIVIDGNIVTAVGDAFREFAITIARQVGFECRDEAMSGIDPHWKEEDFIHHLPKEELDEFYQTELGFFEENYHTTKQALQ